MVVNKMLVVIVAFSILFLLSLIGVRKCCLTDHSDFFSKESTNWLRGIAIIFIMLAHYFASINSPWIFQTTGSLGVALFFLLSGFGLMAQKQKRSDYYKGFIVKRIFRIVVPFIIAFAFCCVMFLICGFSFENNLFFEFFTLSLPDTINWYLKIQMIMYIVFWLLMLALKNKSNKLFVVIIFSVSLIYMAIAYISGIETYWFSSTLYFPLGMLLAMYKDKLYALINKKYIISVLISIVLFIAGFGLLYFIGGSVFYEMLYTLSVVLIFITILVKVHGNSKILLFMGNYSLELYLSHTIIYKLLVFVDAGNILWFFAAIIASVLLAVLIKKLSDLIVSGINTLSNKVKHTSSK